MEYSFFMNHVSYKKMQSYVVFTQYKRKINMPIAHIINFKKKLQKYYQNIFIYTKIYIPT